MSEMTFGNIMGLIERYVAKHGEDDLLDLAEALARAEAAETQVAALIAKLQSAKSEVDEILRAALSGDCDRYLNYDLQGNKYCKWGIVSKDIAAVFDVTEPSDIDVSEQGFND